MRSSRPDARAPVYVMSPGASTPVGRDAWSSAAAVRAGISGFAQHPYMVDTAGHPMQVAIASWLHIDLYGCERFEALLLPAIEQALESEVADRPDVRIALALALPPDRPGLPDDLHAHLRGSIERRFGDRFAAIGMFDAGHAAGLMALSAAMRKMSDGDFEACVVAGVESYIGPETLEWLEETEQLHGAGALNNAWGFVPGEGAGAVLLAVESVVERAHGDPCAKVLSVGLGFEENRIRTPTVCVGEGLTAAFREGLGGLPAGAKITDVYCDMNGEPYRADEYGFACLRTKDRFVSASDFVAPADCWGDVSAASAPLGLALSAVTSAKGYAGGPYALLWASSDSGERGAALLALRVSRDLFV
jgi:3-oxoacyl-[acyl-carrier-protein] synthase I